MPPHGALLPRSSPSTASPRRPRRRPLHRRTPLPSSIVAALASRDAAPEDPAPAPDASSPAPFPTGLPPQPPSYVDPVGGNRRPRRPASTPDHPAGATRRRQRRLPVYAAPSTVSSSPADPAPTAPAPTNPPVRPRPSPLPSAPLHEPVVAHPPHVSWPPSARARPLGRARRRADPLLRPRSPHAPP